MGERRKQPPPYEKDPVSENVPEIGRTYSLIKDLGYLLSQIPVEESDEVLRLSVFKADETLDGETTYWNFEYEDDSSYASRQFSFSKSTQNEYTDDEPTDEEVVIGFDDVGKLRHATLYRSKDDQVELEINPTDPRMRNEYAELVNLVYEVTQALGIDLRDNPEEIFNSGTKREQNNQPQKNS